MDEEYELVSKEVLKELKEENKQLKEKLKSNQKNQITTPQIKDPNFTQKIIEHINKNTQTQQENLLKELNDIKELNKSTLDNVLHKTASLDSKLEHMVENLADLTREISNLIDELPQSHTTELQEKINSLKESLDSNSFATTEDQIFAKLSEIDTFMKNLRILLSYIKPNDFKVDKNQFDSNQM